VSPRPPTLREKKRYLLARIEPDDVVPEQKDLYYAISDAVTSLWGDAEAAVVAQAVVAAEKGHVIIRCRRGADVRITLRPVAFSGTMASLRQRIRSREPVKKVAGAEGSGGGSLGRSGEGGGTEGVETPEISLAGKKFMAVHCEGKKVNLIEKGFKNTNRLFLTSEDLEES
jgi:ribonuclease P/MRP protein subunit POP5